jgi:eukaryotic-like serine/threonine-protein kinase
MAGILEREPAPMGDAAPPSLERIVRRCLAKDPADRWQSVRDLKAAIEVGQALSPVNRSFRWIGAAAIAAAALLGIFLYRPAPPVETSRFTIAPVGSAAVDRAMEYTMLPLAVSPDGRYLAFTGLNEGSLWLWVRPLASEQAVRIENTRGAAMPFWSPDSQQIAFFAPLPPESGKRTWQLKRIPVGGGSPELICDTANTDGGTWNRDGTILFASGNTPIYRVPASGGRPAPVTKLDAPRGETSHSMPEFLPDGRHFLFWANNRDSDKRAIWVGSLDTPDRHMVVLNDGMPSFAAPDRMLFSRDGRLYAQRLDLKRFQLIDKPVRIGENVRNLRRAFSASANGVLAYRETGSSASQGSELVWYSRQGKRLGPVGERLPYREVRLSPNERYVALDAVTNKGSSIFLLDLQTNVTSRLSSNARNDDDPVWSPDSRSIVYVNHSGGPDTDEPVSLWQLKLGEPGGRLWDLRHNHAGRKPECDRRK